MRSGSRLLSPPAIRVMVAAGIASSLGWGFSVAQKSDSPPRHGLTGEYYGLHLGSPGMRYDFRGVVTDKYGIPTPVPGKRADAVRMDDRIAFGRDRGFVGREWLPAETGAVIWTGTIRLPKAGTYYFAPVSYNSSAVFVNEARVALNGFLGGVVPSDAFRYEHLMSSSPAADEKRFPESDQSYLVPVIVDGPRDFPIEVRLSTRNRSAAIGFGIDLYWVTPDSPRGGDGKPIARIIPAEALFVDPPGPIEQPRVSAAHSTISSDFLYLPRDELSWATITVRLADETGRGVPGRRVHVSSLAEHGRRGAAFITQPENPTDQNGVTTAQVNLGPFGTDVTLFATDQNEAVDLAQVAEILAGPSLKTSFIPETLAPYYDDRKFLVEPMPLAVGRPATIRTPLVNRTERTVELTATFSMKSLNIGAWDWDEIGRASIDLQPGETKEVSYTWTPTESTGHVCFRIDVGGRYRSEPARAGALFPLAAIVPAANAGNENVPVDTLTRNIGPVAPVSPCDDGAAEMRREYRELGEDLARRTPNVAPSQREQYRQQRLDEYAALQERWEALAAECSALGIEIHDLEGSELPSSPPGEYERRRKEWKEESKRLSKVGRDFAAGARQRGQVYSKLGELGGEMIGGPEGWVFSHGIDVLATTEMDKLAKSWEEWSDRWNGAANDPPSPEFQNVIEPELPSMDVSSDAGALERVSARALEARSRENAYLDAWVGSYERYQGAEAANDPEGMARQAEAMAQFARSAIGETRAASRLAYDFEQALLSELLDRSRSLTEAPDSDEVRQQVATMQERFEAITPAPPDLATLESLLLFSRLLQERLDPSGSAPGMANTFAVVNPHDREETIDLFIRRAAISPEWKLSIVDAPGNSAEPDGASVREVEAGRHYRVRLPARGETRVASVVVPYGAVAENTTARWAVEGRIRNELIGGMMHEMPVAASSAPLPAASIPAPGTRWRAIASAVGILLLAAVLAVVLLVRRRGPKRNT